MPTLLPISSRFTARAPRRAARRLVGLALLTVAGAGPASCATRGGPAYQPSLGPREEVDQLSAQTRALLEAQALSVWSSWVRGAPLTLESDRATRLMSPESVRVVDLELARAASDGGRRALRHLKVFLAGEALARGLANEQRELTRLTASLSLTADGRGHRLSELDLLLSREPLATRRRGISAAAAAAIQRANPTLERRRARLRSLVRELTYDSISEFVADARDASPQALAKLARDLLRETDDLYAQWLAEAAPRELGVDASALRQSDLPRLFRPRALEGTFPVGRLEPNARATLEAMGLPLAELPGLQLDLENRATKNAGALTLAIRVPDDVRVSLKPVGGWADQAALLAELGQALSYLLTTERRFELAALGSPVTTRATALLFEQLAEEPSWLAGSGPEGSTSPLSGLRRARAAHQLFLARRQAARILYGSATLSAEPSEALHRTAFDRALAIASTPDEDARYLLDADDLLESADALRASLLSAQLAEALEARCGARWFQERCAGTLLRELWAPGRAISADELAARLGFTGVVPAAFVARLRRVLESSRE